MPLEPPPPRAKKLTQKQQFDAVWTDQNNADYDASTCWTASLAPTAEELQEFTSRAHRINQPQGMPRGPHGAWENLVVYPKHGGHERKRLPLPCPKSAPPPWHQRAARIPCWNIENRIE